MPVRTRPAPTADPAVTPRPVPAPRAAVGARTLRKDNWWVEPLVTVVVLAGFVVYGMWAALRNGNYFHDPYLSPFYSPCLTDNCLDNATPHIFGDISPVSPALIILVFPLGFRLTCYYYRKAYYRSFWWAPPACSVPDFRRGYQGETRFPLILQNIHRYFWYFAVIFAGLLTYDAVLAFIYDGHFGIGVGTGVLVVNAALIWLYSLSCHSCRHLCGGGLKQLSAAPLRRRVWARLSVLNRHHMFFAWASLLWIMVADFYIWLVASGHLTDAHWVS
ncbi:MULTISPECIES: hypothetical protein [unclassified Pseudofrankia]|uniref:hypothetical protein n=1 Tax=unclassified Pseudofrankia TaxID=2994372 RepID=UPI0008D96E1F|nr:MULTISPECIES: hypothetical protein [unclassified Pseudofrankia]MDT3438803.1 hypothetical protein [Pseudofrankia sp. BMG5.37]OHV75187.1 hypothetical protein BCD48_00110 [Pseudofrankia sp. BMG5.36]